MITILGPTAAGKTSFAAKLAYQLNGEIISADSRQVYKGMNLGTGKDYDDYIVNGNKIPYHLIDIVDPGYEYNVYEYQSDFLDAYHEICSANKIPLLCGGSGLYLEAVLKSYNLIKVPLNEELRVELKSKTEKELINILKSFGEIHNVTDTKDRKRLIRAIEIRHYYKKHNYKHIDFPEIPNVIFGIFFEREMIRNRITIRLKQRLDEGLIEEVKKLLGEGLKAEQLIFYGLEYKFVTQYILGKITFAEMFKLLNTAIHQFAKRQMTWFRKMEKDGLRIYWLDGEKSSDNNIEIVTEILKSHKIHCKEIKKQNI